MIIMKKIPMPKQLPSGNWRVQITIDGKRKSITENSKELCLAKALAYRAEIIKRKENVSDITLSKAIDNYISARESVLSPSTICGYKKIKRTRFESIMKTRVRLLNKDLLQKVVNDEAKLCGAKTLLNSWLFLSSVIFENTGERFHVKLPQIVPNERPFLAPEQITTFLRAIHGTEIEIPALLGLWGLRRSEIIGLKWESIDIKKRTIKVENTKVMGENNRLVEKKKTKNATSRRTIPMVNRLAELLSSAPHVSEYVCTINAETLYRKINKICENNGLPRIGLHGLRHSFASLAYSLNVPEKIAMQIGGWANDNTMRRIYTHIAQSNLVEYTDKMVEFFNSPI